jgi:hypothetical protein
VFQSGFFEFSGNAAHAANPEINKGFYHAVEQG